MVKLNSSRYRALETYFKNSRLINFPVISFQYNKIQVCRPFLFYLIQIYCCVCLARLYPVVRVCTAMFLFNSTTNLTVAVKKCKRNISFMLLLLLARPEQVVVAAVAVAVWKGATSTPTSLGTQIICC